MRGHKIIDPNEFFRAGEEKKAGRCFKKGIVAEPENTMRDKKYSQEVS